MRGRSAQRIDASAFFFENHAGKAKLMDNGALLRRQSADQILAMLTVKRLVQPLAGEARHGSH